MPGFYRRTLVLQFEDPSWGGLEVKARSANLEFLMRFQELMHTNLGGPDSDTDRAELFAKLAYLLEGDGHGWNLLDDDGKPVPTTAAKIAKEEWPLIRAICKAWVLAVAEVDAPLSPPSSAGDRLAALQDVPMESLSNSPPISSPPNG